MTAQTAPTTRVEYDDEEQPAAYDPAQAMTEDEAARMVAAILSAHRDAQAAHVSAAAYVERVEKRAASVEAYYLPQLEHYYEQHPPRRGRTLHLVSGELAARTAPEAVKVADPEAVKAWASEHLRGALRSVIKETVQVDAATIKAHVATTGEVPPGVVIVPARETLTVKAAKGSDS